jgi:hypothetical protein
MTSISNKTNSFRSTLSAVMLILALAGSLTAAGSTLAGGVGILDDRDEVLLIFSHPAVGRVYLTGLYDYNTGIMMISVTELFNLVEIPFSRENNGTVLRGVYQVGGEEYALDFQALTGRAGRRRYSYDSGIYACWRFQLFRACGGSGGGFRHADEHQ